MRTMHIEAPAADRPLSQVDAASSSRRTASSSASTVNVRAPLARGFPQSSAPTSMAKNLLRATAFATVATPTACTGRRACPSRWWTSTRRQRRFLVFWTHSTHTRSPCEATLFVTSRTRAPPPRSLYRKRVASFVAGMATRSMCCVECVAASLPRSEAARVAAALAHHRGESWD